MNQRQIETISGVVADLTVKPTRTGRSMITFTLSGKNCKAFDKVAGSVQGLTGEQIELQVTRGSYAGKDEYCVIRVHGANSSTVEDTSRTNVTLAPAPGMVRWHVRRGERERFRSEIVKYGTARMLEIFDKLPHPDCSEEQWNELMKEFRENEKAHAEELRANARSLDYSDEEITNYAANTGGALGWQASKASVIDAVERRRQLYGPSGTTSRAFADARPA